MGEQRCAAQHFGPWMIEPDWFHRAVKAVRAGVWPQMAGGETEDETGGYKTIQGNIALIGIRGQMTKYPSSFGGTSTIAARRALRNAKGSDDIKGVLLAIDSPGGTVSGLQVFADDVAAANETKPVHAFIEDTGASAAYFVASQAGHISANPMAVIGSIGTVAILEDTSGAYEKEGVKVHVVSTGKYKGAFADGAPIDDDQLQYAQGQVETLNEFFLKAVKRGRGLSMPTVREYADGRMHVAADAAAMGLIDTVESFDKALSRLRSQIKSDKGTPRTDRAIRNKRIRE